MPDVTKRSVDPATQQVLKHIEGQPIKTTWDRHDEMQPQCGFGQLGICCTNCYLGPCRIDPFGEGAQQGVCGADADTIVARNLLRHIAAGAAAHSDHGRGVAHALHLVGKGKIHDYHIQDEEKLKQMAKMYDIKIEGRSKEEIAVDLGDKFLGDFGSQEGPIKFISRAPRKRIEVWKKAGIIPRGVDREIVEAMHRVHIGVDNEYKSIILHGMRASLGDGWGGSMIATEAQDILLRTPEPIRGTVNLGVLKEDQVNIIVHGHEALLPEAAAKVVKDPEMIKLAKEAGANGINLAGMCCTANEVLMRHEVPLAGNFLQQELAIATGAVEMMMVDIQCIMPGLIDVAKCFHTEIITTSEKAKFPGVTFIHFDEHDAINIMKSIVKKAIENYKKRDKSRVFIPKDKKDLVAGISTEVISCILGGKYLNTFKPLNEAIINGRIRGVAGVVGCNNPKITHDYGHLTLVKELLKNDVIVLSTGCSAIACGKAGFLQPEAAFEAAGKGLKEVCEAVGIPPVLHMGSCVDNSRILIAACEVLKAGGLGEDISDLPAAGAAPEWMSEKAISIGFYFVSSGVFTVLGGAMPVLGSQNVTKFLTEDMESVCGGKFAFEADPLKAATLMIDHINKKREALRLRPMMYQGK
ncbi:MAG: anaerobic carbon-monoxide dehydrogenase catalytic subunit [Candidatus Omnitrophica bacterium]|nr:anaerobic carbon-monoxide dehydrogenase catalytic subunit [Candidatus Omnitrophota bacterium]